MSDLTPGVVSAAVPSIAKVVLRAEELRGGYGKKEVLRGVSLAVRPGEIVALIGPNGAGKSTVLKALAGLLRLTSGQVFLNDDDVTLWPPHRRRREGMAYLMQAGAIFPSLSVKEHLTLSGWAAGGISSEHGEAWPLPENLSTRREPAGFFSGGQRQSLALATVLVRRPKILLCDEPSAGLAPSAANKFLRQIANLARQRDLPVLCWVEQRVGDILPLVDRAILLRDGRIAAETVEPKKWLSPEVLAEITFGSAKNEFFGAVSRLSPPREEDGL